VDGGKTMTDGNMQSFDGKCSFCVVRFHYENWSVPRSAANNTLLFMCGCEGHSSRWNRLLRKADAAQNYRAASHYTYVGEHSRVFAFTCCGIILTARSCVLRELHKVFLRNFNIQDILSYWLTGYMSVCLSVLWFKVTTFLFSRSYEKVRICYKWNVLGLVRGWVKWKP
jgi:hypothetical protein